jgi:hypothetical protein
VWVCLLLLALLGAATPAAASAPGRTTSTLTAGTRASDAAAARWGDRRLDEVEFLTTHNAFTN